MKCPYCLDNFHESWFNHPHQMPDINNKNWQVRHAACPACGEIIMELGMWDGNTGGEWTYQLIKPKGVARTPLSKVVPAIFADDYKEACLVLNDSPKASAALSRRCLQNILREKANVQHRNLAEEIQQVLDAKQLPSHILNDLDAIRNIGNFAAHPLKNTNTGEIVDVEPGEAEWNLDVLEALFDYYFVQPEVAQRKRDALNQKLQAAGKQPMKQPTP